MPLALVWQALATILFIVAGALPASAQTLRAVPALTARVIDQTATLSDTQRQALESRLATIEQQQGSQVVVLMVPSTAPEDIAAFANRVGNAWKIGRRAVGDGVLIIVAKDDRRMRIEVAKALEGAIPDIAAARIIDGTMQPRFRAGDFAGGLDAAVQQIAARISGEGLPSPGVEGPARGAAQQSGFDWTHLAIFLFFGVTVAGPLVRRLFGQRLGGVVMGGGVGLLAFVVTSSPLLAALAALAALVYTWAFAARSAPIVWHGGGWGGGRGGWGGSGGGGGFGSGGGGDFGGGGASGDW